MQLTRKFSYFWDIHFFFLIFLHLVYLFILFMAVLGLRFCVRAFSSCGKRGPLLIAVRGPLTIAASLLAEHRLQTRWLSNYGSRAQLLRGMWDLPRLGPEPVSPELAGKFSTTAPPGKPWDIHFKVITRIMTYNIIPEHLRFLEISCNAWNIYINIFPYK